LNVKKNTVETQKSEMEEAVSYLGNGAICDSKLVVKQVKTVLVTGGCGFIGSHLVDALMRTKTNVDVVDNLSAGTKQNINQWLDNSLLRFFECDLLDTQALTGVDSDFDFIFHLAANPEVRVSSVNPQIHFQQNVIATYNLLEYIRKNQNECTIAFASTSAVYGEPNVIPTPETYAPLAPISIYGATKLACEALITAYAYNYGLKAKIFRLANIIGPRSDHGVIHDFILKLKNNPHQLEILGDGTQTKSYLYVDDCIQAMIKGVESGEERVQFFNVGSDDQINVKEIGEIVIETMKLQNVETKLTGGVDGGRGWSGDVKIMLLDTEKIKSIGWTSKLSSEQAVRHTVKKTLFA
jgi:UDP-glucose 4-epimerase